MNKRPLVLALLASGSLCQLVSVLPANAQPSAKTESRSVSQVVLGRRWANEALVQGFGEVAPKTFYLGGDPTGRVEEIKWKNWGQPQATGTGMAMYVPADKTVAEGIKAVCIILAWDIGKCNSKSAYRALNWYFPKYRQKLNQKTFVDVCRGGYVDHGKFTSMGLDR